MSCAEARGICDAVPSSAAATDAKPEAAWPTYGRNVILPSPHFAAHMCSMNYSINPFMREGEVPPPYLRPAASARSRGRRKPELCAMEASAAPHPSCEDAVILASYAHGAECLHHVPPFNSVS